jgi:hypothetical protein
MEQKIFKYDGTLRLFNAVKNQIKVYKNRMNGKDDNHCHLCVCFRCSTSCIFNLFEQNSPCRSGSSLSYQNIIRFEQNFNKQDRIDNEEYKTLLEIRKIFWEGFLDWFDKNDEPLHIQRKLLEYEKEFNKLNKIKLI